MKSILKLAIASLMAVGLLTGCGSSKATVTVAEATPQAIPSGSFDVGSGEVTGSEDVVLDAKSGDTLIAEVTIEPGTGFVTIDENGNETRVTSAPFVHAKATTSSGVTTTEVYFATADGTIVYPNQTVTAKVAAPAGVKDGETISIDVPDGITADNSKTAPISQKRLINAVVRNGYVTIHISFTILKNNKGIIVVNVHAIDLGSD